MNLSTLHEVWRKNQNLLKEAGTVVIAGGAVRDTLMGKTPKDYDIFILSDGRISTFTGVAQYVREQLKNKMKLKAKVEWHKSEPFLIETILEEAGECQIMARNLQTIDQLLDTFDWNVSLFAYDGKQIIQREDVKNIKIGGELWLQCCFYPRSTLRRGFRFSERFHMKFRKGTIEHICGLVAEQHKIREAKNL